MYTYHSDTGKLFDANGKIIGTGYSGTGKGRNNPSLEAVSGVGPVPRGVYKILQSRFSPTLGPIVMNLEPDRGTNTFGRSLFRIHGNNKLNDASHGCIILSRDVRKLIASGADRQLRVVV